MLLGSSVVEAGGGVAAVDTEVGTEVGGVEGEDEDDKVVVANVVNLSASVKVLRFLAGFDLVDEPDLGRLAPLSS
jgi:hypothetical protein